MTSEATTRRRSLISGQRDKRTIVVGSEAAETEPLEGVDPKKAQRKSRRPRSKRRLSVSEKSASTICLVGSGQTLSGRYVVESEIARGAMGIVFEGRDSELDDTPIALKVLPPESTENEEARKQLRDEAMAAMTLTHTNIVRLHGYERDGQTDYLVMELIDGPTLDEVLADREKLEFAEVVEIAESVCPALDYAHDRGVIHRDIKPSNLMVAHEAGTELIKITDFGIAARAAQADTIAAGTLLYIAPEQLKREKVDGRSDQYSLAATLYELLSGKPPIEGLGLSKRILTEVPKPLADIPEWANEALLKALSKEPKKRFASCTEFMKALVTAPAAFEIPDDCLPGTEDHHKATYWQKVGYRFKRQIFSFALDVALPGLLAMVLAAAVGAAFVSAGSKDVAGGSALVTFFASFVFCYLVMRDLDSGRFSIYKRLFGLRVVNKNLERCSAWCSLVRNLCPFLPAVGFLFVGTSLFESLGTALGTLLVIEFCLLTYISPTRRLGDLLAGTRIVYEGAIEPEKRAIVNERTHTIPSLITLATVISVFAALITFHAH